MSERPGAAFLDTDPERPAREETFVAEGEEGDTDKVALPVPGAGARAASLQRMVGTELCGYELLSLLGMGAASGVFRARQRGRAREVALKVLSEEGLRDPLAAAQLQQEARIASRLSHPGITRVLDLGMHPTRGPVVVMERLQGLTLHESLQRGPMTEARTVWLGQQLCEILQATHEEGVIHRDIKPENLFLCARGPQETVKLLDFGAAKLLQRDTEEQATGPLRGTPRYMPPEQFEGGAVDARNDIYALGCVLYQTLTQRPPYPEESYQGIYRAIRAGEVPRAKTVRPDLSRSLDELIARCMAPDRAQRYPSARELLTALQQPRGWEWTRWLWNQIA